MVLFELLQLVGFFLDYLRIAYLWHVLIMPLTNRNGITPSTPAGIASTRCLGGRVCTDEVCGRKKDGDEDYHQQTPHEYIPPLVVPAFQPVRISARRSRSLPNMR